MDITPPVGPGVDRAARATAVTGAFAAIVFRDVLKPLAAALGPAGEVLLDRVVDGSFVNPKR